MTDPQTRQERFERGAQRTGVCRDGAAARCGRFACGLFGEALTGQVYQPVFLVYIC